MCDRLLLSGFLAGKRDFTRDDVEMVAREMHDETVDAEAVAPNAGRHARRGRGARSAAARGCVRAMPRGCNSTRSPPTRPLALLAKMQADPIEERLARLERRADAIVALLQQLLDAVRPQAAKKQVKP